MVAFPKRPITELEIAEFRQHGVFCGRGLFAEEWLGPVAEQVERIAADPTILRGKPVPSGTFLGDAFVWKQFDAFRDFARFSPAARIAQRVLGATRVNLFHDQLFVKPVGCTMGTPWHHDVTFWPIEGTQICTLWIALNDITKANSGLEFVRGSNRWGKRFVAQRPDDLAYTAESDLEQPPAIEENRRDYDLVSWDLQRGDVLVFDPCVLHSSSANLAAVPRHAFASRWAGDDIRYAPGHARMLLQWAHGLRPGDPLGGPLFPQVLPEQLDEEWRVRALGPEAKDPALLQLARDIYEQAEDRRRRRTERASNAG